VYIFSRPCAYLIGKRGRGGRGGGGSTEFVYDRTVRRLEIAKKPKTISAETDRTSLESVCVRVKRDDGVFVGSNSATERYKTYRVWPKRDRENAVVRNCLRPWGRGKAYTR